MNKARALIEALMIEGLTMEDILVVTQNRLVARAVVAVIQEASLALRGLTDRGFPKYMRGAKVLLGESALEYEILVAASILQLRETNPTQPVNLTAVGKVLGTSRQAVSKNLATKKINFVELKKRLL